MSDEVYCYPPDFNVLRNKLGIRDAAALDEAERGLVIKRSEQGPPTGDFDLAHLRAIHRHLFQDIYDWAGAVRTVEISKGGSGFMPRRFIATGMNDIHRRIVEVGYFAGTVADAFAREAGTIIGDVNHVHPFREGNGRTQVWYLKQLAGRAGHDLDLLKLNRESWMAASRASQNGDYAPFAACILAALRT